MQKAGLLRLVAVVFTAVTCLTIGDVAGKLLTAGGVSPYLVAWLRFALAALILVPFSGLKRQELPNLLDRRIFFRAVCVVGGVICILTALKTAPMADAFGAFFIGPIVSYVLAIIFLNEHPSRLRSALLAVSFLGVMLVVKPSFDMSIGLVFALAAGVFHGTFLVATRTVAGEFRPRFLLISQLLIGTVILTPLGFSSEFPNMNLNLSGLVIISAAGSAVGNYLLVVASKTAEASLVAPLIYSQLIPATVFGVLVFGDLPDAYSLIGLTMIVTSGVGSLVASQASILKHLRG
ncbi:DMT family transporter [Pseudoruegeria sp. SK021]|uniref:DMT family transporter n=1 Tax=Pseudoruegeria sp. SK021 TaxID=1933035 RepID=UPI000A263620|nr:DMT family transporter [Pseudoruegeria sp. SK021]OSP54020.1 hypothetical protein BV911_14920 [Pseudoruegeria sp. SK021]